jgi:hypothetical protein
MLLRRPRQRRRRGGGPVRPLCRLTQLHRSEAVPEATPVALPARLIPGSHLGRTLYHLRTAEGATCAGRVWQGECLLLFTSQTAATAFVAATGLEARPPLIFSRSRSEFLTQAGRCFGQGFIGGLIDPSAGPGKTEFLGFDVEQRRRGSPPI